MKKRKAQLEQKLQAQSHSDISRMNDVFARESQRRETGESAAQRKACSRKVRYDSREDAEEAARGARFAGGKTLRVYRCDYCDGWHLTHAPER